MSSSASVQHTSAGRDSLSWWATSDHVRIARIQLAGVLAALVLGVKFALVLRAELLSPGPDLIGSGALGSSLTAHGLVMVFLFALPALPLVVGGLVLPPMVGARDFAFPTLNRMALRLYLAAWLLMAFALIAGPIDMAWRLAPAVGGTSGWAVAVAAAGLHLLGLTLACSALNSLATVLYERGESISWNELPVLVWGLTAGAAVQLIVSVALASLSLLIFFEHATSAAIFGGMAADPLAYQRLFDFVLHAGAAVVVLPAIGVAFEVVATFSRKAPAGGRSNALALGALALLSLGGSGVSLLNDGASVALMAAHSGISLLALVPASILLFNLLATLAGGAIEISSPLLHALILVILLAIGGIGGLFLATLSTGAYLQGSLFDSAQLHFLLGGGALAGLTTALYYWWPRLMGRRTSELWGRLGAALLFSGYLLTFLPRFVAGSRGWSTLVLFSGPGPGSLEVLSGIGTLLLVLGLLVVGWDLLTSLLRSPRAESNPWGATTPEWVSGAASTDGGSLSSLGTYDFSVRGLEPEGRSYVVGSGTGGE